MNIIEENISARLKVTRSYWQRTRERTALILKRITNLKTGIVIDTDSIVNESSSGIFVKNSDCIKFIPLSDLKIEEMADDGVYSKSEANPEFNFARDSFSSDLYTEKAEYKFGIANLEFKTVNYFKDTAIITKPIDVSECSYVTLSVKESEAYNSFVEYSIMDGINDEIPILPENRREVIREKLFYGLSTRFIVDNSQKLPVLYEDGKISNKEYNLLTHEDFLNHEYSLDYWPCEESINKYVPKNDSISLKIVIRNYTDIFSPVYISDVRFNIYR